LDVQIKEERGYLKKTEGENFARGAACGFLSGGRLGNIENIASLSMKSE